MDDTDLLHERLYELGLRAPLPYTDPAGDVRRGRAALRRRRGYAAAGITAMLVAIGIAVAPIPAVDGLGNPGGETLTPAESPSRTNSSETDGDSYCEMDPMERSSPKEPSWEHPSVAPALAAYGEAAARFLDPAGEHLDQRVTGLLSSCNPSGLTLLGTDFLWTSGNAVGAVELTTSRMSVSNLKSNLPGDRQWTALGSWPMEDDLLFAWVAHYEYGYGVIVKRPDGLSVAVCVAEVWEDGPRVRDLPSIDELIALAGSPLLTLPVG